MFGTGRAAVVSTVGYMCIAITAWMLSMTAAGWYSFPYSLQLLAPLALVLGVMGILAFVQNRGLDAIVFFGGTALFGAIYVYSTTVHMTGMADPRSFLGWFAGVFAVFFGYVWLGSFKSGITRMIFLLGMWVTLLLLAIGGWTDVRGWAIVAGYCGLVTAVLACIVSANDVIRLGAAGNPNLPSVEAPRAIAAD